MIELDHTRWVSFLQIRESSETPSLTGIILIAEGGNPSGEMLDGYCVRLSLAWVGGLLTSGQLQMLGLDT